MPNERHQTRISVTVTISSKPGKSDLTLHEFCDPDEFDNPNLLAALEDGMQSATSQYYRVCTE